MIKIVGDINFTDGYFDLGYGIGSKIEQGFNPFKYIERNDGDIWVGNFEGVCSNQSNKKGIYAKQFRIASESLVQLPHFDYYGVANNHVMQHGDQAYRQTLDNITQWGSKFFGSNHNRSQQFSYKGNAIFITGFSMRIDAFSNEPLYWYLPERIEIEDEIKSADANSFKIAYIHWGCEFVNYPNTFQKEYAHWLINLGFDMIIGLHPHVLQGYEIYKGKYIFYSIGNFVFNMSLESCKYGVVVNLDFDNKTPKITYDYVYINHEYSPLIKDEKEIPVCYTLSYLNEVLSTNKNIEDYCMDFRKELHKYRRSNYASFIKSFGKIKISLILTLVSDFIKRKFKRI